MKLILTTLICLFFIGCTDDQPLEQTTDKLEKSNQSKEARTLFLEVSYGECVEVPNVGYILCIKKITDSRCPSNVTCIWPGEATVTIDVLEDKKLVTSFDLKKAGLADSTARGTTKVFSRLKRIHSITLLDVNPYPVAPLDTMIDYSAYRVKLELQLKN